jgi:5-carboxymethyl-2-hydroxymuconate isomerase
VADGHNENALIHIQARIGAGRTPEVRRQAAERNFARLKSETASVFAATPLGLSLEIIEIDVIGSLKYSNLHAVVEARKRRSAV